MIKSHCSIFLFGIIFFFSFSMCQSPQEDTYNEKPNILFIMADDLGAESLSCYGSTNFKTPILDRLAQTGVRFENCYATPACVPSRMQLMTGMYPFRTGWTKNAWGEEWYFDADKQTSFANIINAEGYETCVVDKWMLCYDFKDHPNTFKDAGFDEHYMWRLWDTSIPIDERVSPDIPITSGYWYPDIWKNGPVDVGKGEYGPDLFCDYLIDFFKRNKNKPFLAYWPMHLVHRETYHGKTTPPTPLTVSEYPDKTGKTIDKQKGTADMIFYMDKLIGRLVSTLDNLKLREKTLIVFTGDNGTSFEIVSHWNDTIIRGGKRDLTEAGCRVPLIANWPSVLPNGKVEEQLVDFTDFFPTFAEISGATIPQKLTIDGYNFLSKSLGSDNDTRKWVYCQLNEDWFIRNTQWCLYNNGTLYNVTERYNPRIAKDTEQVEKIKDYLSKEVKELRN
jgi:arylsulfatase A